MLPIPAIIKEYAIEDINEAIQRANKQINAHMQRRDVSYERNESNPESDVDEYSIWVEVDIYCPEVYEVFPITFEYVVHGDDVYMGGDMDSWVDSLINNYNKLIKYGTKFDSHKWHIKSSIHVPKQKIVASDVEDSEFKDTFDDLADTVDDMQDQIEEVDEDDIDIELDNNISDHFIAECDRCQGVFISALRQSDQEVEKISGICPLCQKRTDQYLKWIIKDVN